MKNLEKILKEIQEIIGTFDTSDIGLKLYTDNVFSLLIYESEIPISIDIIESKVYVSSEIITPDLTSDMLIELGKICKLLEKNIEIFKEFKYNFKNNQQ